MWITNGSVNAIAVDGSYTYSGGDFTYVGPYAGCGAKITTTNPQPDMAFLKVTGTIYTAIPDGAGGWYIGSSFTKVGTYIRNYIAHINVDGTVDEGFNPNARFNANETLDGFNNGAITIGSGNEQAEGLAIQQDGKIVLAGYPNSGTNNFAIVRLTGSSGPLPVELASSMQK